MTKLKELRTAKRMSMQDLADKTGLSLHSIFRYEHGTRKPDIETAYKIANALDVTFDELIKALFNLV